MNRRFGWMMMLTAGIIANSGCHLIGNHHGCNHCRPGCRPGPIGWQRGGTDYGDHLNGHHHDYRNQQAGSGVPAAAVAYPYYTNRGPRDFLVNNPPTIGR